MKNLILILTTSFLGFTAMSFDLFHPSITSDNDDIEVVFDDSMDKAKLEDIQKDLSQKGIILTYDVLKFHRNGKLKHISFSVDCTKLGFSGSASDAFLGFTKKFGFSVQGTAIGNATFRVGRL